MRAIVCRQYARPEVALRVEDVEKPTPGDNEVLIKVRAAAVNPLDSHLTKGKPYGMRLLVGLTRPSTMRPGRDLAGEVEAVGRNCTLFKPGDEVFGVGVGAFAEYACAPESKLARKPESVTFEHAASAPIAGLTGLQGLHKGNLRPGERLLVNGAAGGVGTFAVQIARSMGADVTGVCSTRNVELVRSLGARTVIDYTREDFTRGEERYDMMLDCICNRSVRDRRRVLTRGGRLVAIGLPPGRWFVGIFARLLAPLAVSPFVSQKMTFFGAKINPEDLEIIGQLMVSGKVSPVIDRREGLEAVPKAVSHIAAHHVRGKVVIVV